jgi:hypothetical protein
MSIKLSSHGLIVVTFATGIQDNFCKHVRSTRNDMDQNDRDEVVSAPSVPILPIPMRHRANFSFHSCSYDIFIVTCVEYVDVRDHKLNRTSNRAYDARRGR